MGDQTVQAGRGLEMQFADKALCGVSLSAHTAEGKPATVLVCHFAPFGQHSHREHIESTCQMPTLPGHRQGRFGHWIAV